MATWIILPSLGRNGLHCVNFLHYMGKLLLNQTPSEPLVLMKKLPYFDDPIKLDDLLPGVLCLGVHDTINFPQFDGFRIEFYRFQWLDRI
jgi:hypothetical protein